MYGEYRAVIRFGEVRFKFSNGVREQRKLRYVYNVRKAREVNHVNARRCI